MNTSLLPQKTRKDLWYKEPWLLLVVGGPFIVVCASIVTGVLAWRGSDKVVSEDYYKQGLMINKDLQRDSKARELQLSASLSMDQTANRLKMSVSANKALPDTVQVSLASSGAKTLSVTEVVRRLAMKQVRPGEYEGDMSVASNSSMKTAKLLHVKVETTEWRLTGDWFDPEQRQVHLKAAK
jgi:hypothetical protein